MENKKIFIEVGSNEGTDTQKFVQDDAILFCFEPVFDLFSNLWNRYKYSDNVIVLPFAIDVDSSIKRFNVSPLFNKGCSSLNQFNDDISKLWPGRSDFNFGDSYMVPTVSLYSFVQMYNINRIDYLWIDAQGHDFNVLKSLRDKIDIVKEGRCEASYNVSLYKDIDNSYTGIIKYLEENRFDCHIELDQSGIGAECDIMFKRK